MNGLTDDMEFESELEEMAQDPKKLNMFIARKVHYMSKQCPKHDERLCKLEGHDKKFVGFIGGAAAIVGAGIAAMIDYLVGR